MQVSGKKSIRDQMRTKRHALSEAVVRAESDRICTRVLALPQLHEVSSVLLYLPIQGEVDTWPLCRHFWTNGLEVQLPKCRTNEPGLMDIFIVTDNSQLGPGAYGITEPLPDKARPCPAPRPEILFIPAVAFDSQGYRLGFGGGYYDRFLSSSGCLGLTIGLAYDFQILPSLPVEPWDCPVDIIITPTRTIIPKEHT